MDSKKLNETNGTPKKKKRCRIRNRPRNKRNRNLEVETTKIVANKLEATKVEENVQLETNKMQSAAVSATKNPPEKTREEIIAEREAKKLAKQVKKNKPQAAGDATSLPKDSLPPTASQPTPIIAKSSTNPSSVVAKSSYSTNLTPVAADKPGDAAQDVNSAEKTREQIKAEREAKKQAKHAAKMSKAAKEDAGVGAVTHQLAELHITGEDKTLAPPPQTGETDIKKKNALSKADRRALQEAQRAAKAQALAKKAPAKLAAPATKPQQKTAPASNLAVDAKPNLPLKSSPISSKSKECKVKLFNHLESGQKDVSLFVNNAQIHPSIARLGEQYSKRTVVGSNARCIAFMNALKMAIQDFETPPKKEFARSLEAIVKVSVDHLQKCRPLAVSVSNAYKHIKHVLTQLPTDRPESELKEHLCHFIDTYIENQIGKAAQAISSSMQEKINNGDVILTFGCSSLINYICEEAHKRKVDFRVIVVDSRPFCEGQELLRRLTTKEIPCTYVLINAVGFVMPEVTKVLLGAHALLSNGYVMARTGTAQVALVANSFNVPVLVCCETHKFSERFQTDAIVYNELGDPHDLVLNEKCCLTNWQVKNKMFPLNLIYDVTPPELVTAVVTEVSVLPCTSVPVILRIKPTEIGYYS